MEDKKTNNVINKLLDISQPFPPQHLHIFSDITDADLKEVSKIWPEIAVSRKINLLEDLEDMMEADTLLSCDDFARFALSDEDANVRSRAISLLWECEDPKLAQRFSEMLTTDENEIVRSAAANALGKFVLMGELEEISKKVYSQILDLLLKLYASEQIDEVRQEILRALSYNGKKEIQTIIEQAYNTSSKAWVVAALESMGRSADSRWEDNILDMLASSDMDYLYEAVRAAGELELTSARPALLDLLEEESESGDLHFQLIWALSKIGGDSVEETLQDLLNTAEDNEEINILELALKNLEFTDENSELDFI